MEKTGAVLAVAASLMAAQPIVAQSDLTKYVEDARNSGMSETAAAELRFIASILSGHSVFRVKREGDGGLQRHILSAECPIPGESQKQRAERLLAKSEATRNAWMANLRKLSDADGSGFVSSEEGSALRRRIYLALTLAQLPEVKATAEFAELIEEEQSEVQDDLAAYAELQAIAERKGIQGLPDLRPEFRGERRGNIGDTSVRSGGSTRLTTDQSIPGDEFALCTVRGARGTGTGFAFLKPDWIVTAKHVVSGQPPAQPLQLLFREGLALPARVLFEHPQVDLAVLEVVGNSRCRAPFMPCDRAPISSGLRCVGYKPSISDKDAGRYAVSRVDSYERTTRQRDGYEEILFIFPAPHGEPGRSGGPLLASTGSVIGVVMDGITLGGQHVMRATSIVAVLDHLALPHHQKWQQPSIRQTKEHRRR